MGTLPSNMIQTYAKLDILDIFSPVSDEEANDSIHDIAPKISPMDSIPMALLKGYSDVFRPLITNLLFTEGTFSIMFKTGQVTPLLKNHGVSRDDMANYRPITNLNTIGILERLVLWWLWRHMPKSANIGHLQSAYRTLHSTETAMAKVISDQLMATDGSNPSILLSLDISAAFDTLDHCHLLERDHNLFSFSASVLDWLRSYLAGHQQYVAFGSCRSSSMLSTSGMLQGSVLSPLLFSIFTTPVSCLITFRLLRFSVLTFLFLYW